MTTPAGEHPVPHLPCPACAAPAHTPHTEDCPWVAQLPPAWRKQPAYGPPTAAQVGLEDNT